MDFKLDNNTIILIIVLAFLAYYLFAEYKEGFKQQRGISRSSRSLTRKGQPQVVVTPPPPVVVTPPPPPVVVTPPPPPVVLSDDDLDFAGLL
jgi:hypothetical protein